MDDIAEVGVKAANKVDDAAEIGVKAAGKVDDVAEVGAKAASKIDDVAGSSTKLGNSLAEMMSPEDAAKYQKFLEKGSTSGLKPEELQGITKVDAYQALNKVDYNEVLKLRKVGSKGSKITIPDKAKNIAQQVKSNNGTPPKGYEGGRIYENIPFKGDIWHAVR